MVEVYYYDITSQSLTNAEYQSYLSLLPEQEQVRIEKFRFQKDRLLSLFGLLMVYSKAGTLENWVRTELGKPFLNNSELHFSISHSGDYVVAAFQQNKPLGIDIERIRDIDFKDFHVVFRQDELDELNSKEDFFTLWSQKESIIKALGTGFSLDPRELYLKGSTIAHEGKTWSLQVVDKLDGYSCWMSNHEIVQFTFDEFKSGSLY